MKFKRLLSFGLSLVPWFDAEGVAQAVHNYENGETQAVYSEEAESQAMSELVEKLLGKMQ